MTLRLQHLNIILTFIILLVLAMQGCKAKSLHRKEKTVDGGVAKFKNEADKMLFDNLFFDATKAKLLGRYDEATEKFNQCLKINNSVAEVYYQLYQCLAQTGKPKAMEMLDKSITLDENNEWYLGEKANILRNNRRNEEAAKLFTRLCQLKPNKKEYYEDAAQQWVLANNPEEAINILAIMETRFGLSEDVIRRKEELYLMMGRQDKAILEIKKLVDAMPSNVTYIGMLAELYAISNQTAKAIEFFNKVLTIDPSNGRAHFGLAGLYRQQGDSANTIKELMLGFADENASSKEKIAVILSIAPLGDNDDNYRKQIFELAEILIKTHPNEAAAHAIYADLLFGDGQLQKAAQQYEETLLHDANNFKVWQQLLTIYLQLENYEALQTKSDEALEFFPNKVVLYYYNAVAAYKLNNYKKASAVAQAGIDLGIGDDATLVNLYSVAGDIYYQLKQYDDSYAAFETALTIDPFNPNVLNNYAYYLALQEQRLEKALTMAKQAVDIQPASPSYLDTYGWVLYKNGKYTDAQKYIQKALDASPANATILEHMGDVYYQLGNKQQAISYWQKAKENGNPSAQLEKKIHDGKLP